MNNKDQFSSTTNLQYSEIEEYRLKLYKWDKLIASVLPLFVLTSYAYIIKQMPIILFVGFGNLILILYSTIKINSISFKNAKLLHFTAAFGVILVCAFIFPFMKYEYMLMPLTALTVFTTYPFQEQKMNYWIGAICMLTGFFLFALETLQTTSYPEYDTFNQLFLFIIFYISFVEIVMTALIGNKYVQIINRNTAKLKQQKQELEKYIESNLQLENFAHIASHDLKTPLSNVIRFSQLLELKIKDKLSPREMELFSFIIDGSRHMNETINSLFQFSTATNRKLSYTRFYLQDIIAELENDITVDVRESKADIQVEAFTDIIIADKVLIKQLFLNLILNSMKFIKKGDSPKISIRARKIDQNYRFEIQDNGIGVDAAYADSIFLIFKRLHGKASYEGTGAGLAICKKIVEQHGGEIWVESEIEKGSSFYFTIPIHTHLPQE